MCETFSDYYSEHRQTSPACLRGRRRPNMGFADRGPTRGSGQPPRARTESCQPWRGAGRAGEECRQHYTGDHGYEDQEHAGHTLHADTAGVLQLPFPSVAPVAGCRADNIYTCVCARIFRTRQQHTSCKQCSWMLNLGSGHLFVVCLRCGLFSNISSA